MSIKTFYVNYMAKPVYNPYSTTIKILFLCQNVSARLRFSIKRNVKNGPDMVFWL